NPMLCPDFVSPWSAMGDRRRHGAWLSGADCGRIHCVATARDSGGNAPQAERVGFSAGDLRGARGARGYARSRVIYGAPGVYHRAVRSGSLPGWHAMGQGAFVSALADAVYDPDPGDHLCPTDVEAADAG